MSVFGVFLVRIFPHFDWIRRGVVRMWENTDQKNSEYGRFSRSDSWPYLNQPCVVRVIYPDKIVMKLIGTHVFISIISYRSTPPDVLLGKGVLKICSKFTGEQPCQSVISITLLWNFIEITFWHEYSSVNLLYIFRTPFPKNTSGERGLLLYLNFQDYFEKFFHYS